MSTKHLFRTFFLICVLAVILIPGISCVPRSFLPEGMVPNLPAVSKLDTISTPTLVPPAPRGLQKPEKSQTARALPVPASMSELPGFSLILGRPTTGSITASLYSEADTQISLAYGTSSGNYTDQTDWISLKANTPQSVELTNLVSDTTYFYRLTMDGTASGEHTFHTQRAPGSTFTFTIDADPHNREPNFNGELFAATLTNIITDHPDFHIDLGDTFMTEKAKPQSYAEAESTFAEMRPYFGILGADVPLFLVNGNHEGELGWLLAGNDMNIPIWSTQIRQLYYPNPSPNDFYMGSSTTDAYLGSIRDGYYAWNWGEALFIVLDPFWYTSSKPRPDDLNSNWNWTLGREQYDWLKSTLETSTASFKFIFIHHLVGGNDKDGRGGIEAVPSFEWGGRNADGTYGFDEYRPGWGVPIHQLLVQNHVSAVFHGHDHVFVKQELDGVVYQECPQPDITNYNNTQLAQEYGYIHGVVISNSGHLRVTVLPEQVKVEYVRAYLPQDEGPGRQNGQVDYTYVIPNDNRIYLPLILNDLAPF